MHGGVVPLSYVATHNITLDTKKTLLQCYPFAPLSHSSPCPVCPHGPCGPGGPCSVFIELEHSW